MNKINYQKELEYLIDKLPDHHRRLFLHSCCAPCSSYCLEYLRQYFDVTVFYYNPNISFLEEYRHRVEELKRLVSTLNEEAKGSEMLNQIALWRALTSRKNFRGRRKGWRTVRGRRALLYLLRAAAAEAARLAAEGGYDFFTTTLTISPLKNAQKLNEIGSRLAEEYHVACLPSDFKKKGGYLRSIELSRQYDLYRQDYCGCVFSKRERDKRIVQES